MVEYLRRAFSAAKRSPHLIAVHRDRVVTVLGLTVVFIFAWQFISQVFGASYPFTQTTWSTVDTISNIQHQVPPTTTWNKYRAASSSIDFLSGGGSLGVTEAAGNSIMDTHTDFQGLTAVDLTEATYNVNDIGISGTGALAKLTLARDAALQSTFVSGASGIASTNRNLSMAVSPNTDNIYIVYRNADTIYFRMRINGTWTSSMSVPGSNPAQVPALAVDFNGTSDRLHLVFRKGTGANMLVYTTCVISGTGCTWSTLYNIEPMSGGQGMPALAVLNGILYAVHDVNNASVKFVQCTIGSPTQTGSAATPVGCQSGSAWTIISTTIQSTDAIANYLKADATTNKVFGMSVSNTSVKTVKIFSYTPGAAVAMQYSYATEEMEAASGQGIDIDSAGRIHAAWYRKHNSTTRSIQYVRCSTTLACTNPAPFTVTTNPDYLPTNLRDYISLAVNPETDLPVIIAFFKTSDGGNAIRRYDCSLDCVSQTNGWQEVLAGTGAYLFNQSAKDTLELRFVGSDTPHIAFMTVDDSYYFYTTQYKTSGTYTSGIRVTEQNQGTKLTSYITSGSTPTAQLITTVKIRTGTSVSGSGVLQRGGVDVPAFTSCPTITVNTTIVPDNSCIKDGDTLYQYQIFMQGTLSASPYIDYIRLNYVYIPREQSLESSYYDVETNPASTKTNVAAFSNAANALQFAETSQSNSRVKLQVRMANSTAALATAQWLGPGGAAGTFFYAGSGCTGTGTVSCPLPSSTLFRYFQYRATLESMNGIGKPQLDSVTLTYAVNEQPAVTALTLTSPALSSSGEVSVSTAFTDSDPGAKGELSLYYDLGYTVQSTIPAPGGGSLTSFTITAPGSAPALSEIATSGYILIDKEVFQFTRPLSSPTITLVGARAALNSIADRHDPGASVYFRSANTVNQSTVQTYTKNPGAHTLTWTPKLDIPSVHYASAKVKVMVNDGEAVFQMSEGMLSSAFLIDTKQPAVTGGMQFQSPAAMLISTGVYKTKVTSHSIVTNFTDLSALRAAFSTNGQAASAGIISNGAITSIGSDVSYSTSMSMTANSADSATTYYMHVKDAYGNYGPTTNATLAVDTTAPPTPSNIQITESSLTDANGDTTEVYFTLGWDPVADTKDALNRSDFSKYLVYRSTDQNGTYSLVASSTSRTANSIVDRIGGPSFVGQTFYYKVTSIDDIGNETLLSTITPSSVTAVGHAVDASAPTIGTISSGTPGLNYLPISFSASEKSTAALSYFRNPIGGSAFPIAGPNTLLSGIIQDLALVNANIERTIYFVGADGSVGNNSYDVQARATDQSNNVGTATSSSPVTFPLADADAPNITTVSVTPTVAGASFHVETSEPATVLINIGSAVYGSYLYKTSHDVSVPNIFSSSNALSYDIQVRDVNGNLRSSAAGNCGNCSGQAAHPATTDTTRPTVSAASVTSEMRRATVTWTTDEPSTSQVQYGTQLGTDDKPIYIRMAGDKKYTTSHSVELQELTPNTLYYYRIRSSDGAGNERISSSGTFMTAVLSGSGTAPTFVTGPSVVAAGMSAAVVTLSTNEPTRAVVEVSTVPNFTNSATVRTGVSARYAAAHTVEVPGLELGTFYYARVTIYNEWGQSTISDNNGSFFTFATRRTSSNQKVEISNVRANIGESETSITWSTNISTTGGVQYGSDSELNEYYGSNNSGLEHTVVMPQDLLGQATYSFKVRARTSDGAEGVSSDVAIFVSPSTSSTILADDAAPPTVSNIVVSLVTSNAAVVTWRTNELAKTELEVGETASYGSTYGTSTAFNQQHSVTVTGLSPSKKYYFMIIATDVADNPTRVTHVLTDPTTLLSFTTTEENVGEQNEVDPGDKEAPIISNVEVYDIKSKSAKVRWDTNEDSASLVEYGTVAGVRNSTAGSASNFLRDHDVELTGLKTGTKYYVAVIGLDYSGNRSISEELNFTTTASTTEEEALTELEEQLLEEASKQQLELLESFNTLSSSTQAPLQDFLAGIKTVSDEERAKALKILFGELAGPPRILGSKPNVTVTDTTAVIEWETLTETNSIVSYASDSEFEDDKDNPYTKEAGKKSEFVTVHKVTLTELKPFTTYNFQISGEEKGGTKTIGINRTFKTLPVQPKFESFKIDTITEYSVRVAWETNIPTKAVITIQDRTTGEGRTIEANDLKLEHEYVVKDLKSETKYALFVVAQSEEGETVRTDPRNFQTSPDSVPPEIASVRTKLTLSTGREDNVQAVITWSTDESSTSQVEYIEGARLEGSNLQKSPTLNDLTSSHVVVITRLRPATIYTFRVVSMDAAGNRGESRQFKIFTPRKEESVLELIIKNFEDAFGFLKELQ